jgi:molybdopterin biosynthesis enzyme
VHTVSPNPRIVRFTPLDAALDRLSALASPALAGERPVAQAIGMICASDVRAPASLPSRPVAYADGWAVNADDLAGASAYSAAIIAPPPAWVNADDPMPSGADAVLPPHALTIVAPGMAEASSPIAQGEGVRDAGQDITVGSLIVAEGTRIAPRHAAILTACGIETITVRAPRIRIVVASKAAARQCDLVRMWLEALGVDIAEIVSAPEDQKKLSSLFGMAGVDLVVSLGGTGEGHDDCAVAALAEAGEVDVHGIALRPGGSTAFGQAAGVPVLLLPGRLDALIAGALVMTVPALARISGLTQWDWLMPATLAGKVSSVIGFSELFLAIPQGDAVRPVPLNEAGLDAVARAVGWFIVPPGSEGLPAGQIVHLRPFQPR